LTRAADAAPATTDGRPRQWSSYGGPPQGRARPSDRARSTPRTQHPPTRTPKQVGSRPAVALSMGRPRARAASKTFHYWTLGFLKDLVFGRPRLPATGAFRLQQRQRCHLPQTAPAVREARRRHSARRRGRRGVRPPSRRRLVPRRRPGAGPVVRQHDPEDLPREAPIPRACVVGLTGALHRKSWPLELLALAAPRSWPPGPLVAHGGGDAARVTPRRPDWEHYGYATHADVTRLELAMLRPIAASSGDQSSPRSRRPRSPRREQHVLCPVARRNVGRPGVTRRRGSSTCRPLGSYHCGLRRTTSPSSSPACSPTARAGRDRRLDQVVAKALAEQAGRRHGHGDVPRWEALAPRALVLAAPPPSS